MLQLTTRKTACQAFKTGIISMCLPVSGCSDSVRPYWLFVAVTAIVTD